MVRVGKRVQVSANTAVDLTPLLDTAFILIFFFLFCIVYITATEVKTAHEHANSAMAQKDNADARNQKLQDENEGLRYDMAALQDNLDSSEYENMVLKGQIEELNASVSAENTERLRGYDAIKTEAVLICISLERNDEQRTVNVLFEDDVKDEKIEYDDSKLNTKANQVYAIVDKCLSEMEVSKHDKPKFVYFSRDKNVVFGHDVDVISGKLEELKDKYNNLYVVR